MWEEIYMKKMLLIIMLCAIILTGCGGHSENIENSETNEESAIANETHKPITNTDADELLEEANTLLGEEYFIDGFLYVGGSYEKYNSYASENGLGDTKIYVKGTVLNTEDTSTEDVPQIQMIVEQEDGNRWCVGVAYVDDLGDIVGKEIRAFGIYLGFSDKFNVPAMVAMDYEAKSKIQVKNDNGNYETIWSFQDYILEHTKEPQSEPESEPQSDEEYIPTMGETNALKKAKSYLELMPFSYSGLIEQLEYEKFTHEEAVYGADNCGADWNEQARIKAKSYLDLMSFSKDSLIEQLEYEGFTHEQAVYGVTQNGY